MLSVLTGFAIVSVVRTEASATAAARSTGLNDVYVQARYAVGAEESLERKYRLEPGPAVLEKYEAAAASFVSSLRLVARRGNASDRTLTDDLLVEQRTYRRAIRRMFAAIDAGHTATVLDIDAHEVDPRFGDIEARVAAAAEVHHTDALASMRSLEHVQRASFIATLIAFACGLLLVAFFSTLLVRHRRRAEAAQEAELETQTEAAAVLEASNQRLVELDRLKDEFVAIASHELRTPLTSICGYLELIRGDADRLKSEHAQFFDIIERNANRLQHLVGDLLIVAQVDDDQFSLQFERVALGDVVRESVEAIRPFAQAAGIEVGLALDEEITLVGDQARLGEVVDNMLSNAIKFTPRGGSIAVSVARHRSGVRVEIEDTGIGIASEDRGHLFERFFRTQEATDQAIPGTGLGLAIAAAIVAGHDGAIGVESELGTGSTFWIELPLQPLSSSESTPSVEPVLAA